MDATEQHEAKLNDEPSRVEDTTHERPWPDAMSDLLEWTALSDDAGGAPFSCARRSAPGIPRSTFGGRSWQFGSRPTCSPTSP